MTGVFVGNVLRGFLENSPRGVFCSYPGFEMNQEAVICVFLNWELQCVQLPLSGNQNVARAHQHSAFKKNDIYRFYFRRFDAGLIAGDA